MTGDSEVAKAGSSLDALLLLIRHAARAGILVLLDLHRLVSAIWPDPAGLWYSNLVPETAVRAAWVVLARRFCGEWNVMGADLFNEPHRARWGDGGLRLDWAAAAERIGSTVRLLCPRWLVLVQGVGDPARTHNQPSQFFWGENLVNVSKRPLTLSNSVYSPHGELAILYPHATTKSLAL